MRRRDQTARPLRVVHYSSAVNTIPYTSVNGHMFSFLGKSGTVALRLPTQEREEFLKKFKTDALLKKTDVLKAYVDASYAYVSALKPKPTKRKKTTAAKKT